MGTAAVSLKPKQADSRRLFATQLQKVFLGPKEQSSEEPWSGSVCLAGAKGSRFDHR